MTEYYSPSSLVVPFENLCISSYGNLAANFRAAFVYI